MAHIPIPSYAPAATERTERDPKDPRCRELLPRQSLQRTIYLIKKPASDKMPMLYPGTLSEADVESVAAYIRSFQ